METRTVKRCNKCILPNTCDLIPFDEEGTCYLCNKGEQIKSAADKIQKSRKESIEQFIEKVRERGKGRPYDCIIGLSGGRDSTYLLYLLTKRHNLRCLAAYYRTPFTPDVIDANVRRIVKKLNVPLEEIKISTDYHAKIAREMTLLWKKKHSKLIANLACGPCKFVNREIFRIAQKNKVKTIIYGTNIYEAVQIAAGISKSRVDVPGAVKKAGLLSKLNRTLSLTFSGLRLLGSSKDVWKYLPLGIKSSVMYISPHTLFLSLRYPHIRPINYFYYYDWKESECIDTLKELGWELPEGYNSTWKADCSFAELKNIMFQKTIGITYLDAFLSNMIRAGILTREQALKRIEEEGKISQTKISQACNSLNLPADFTDTL